MQPEVAQLIFQFAKQLGDSQGVQDVVVWASTPISPMVEKTPAYSYHSNGQDDGKLNNTQGGFHM